MPHPKDLLNTYKGQHFNEDPFLMGERKLLQEFPAFRGMLDRPFQTPDGERSLPVRSKCWIFYLRGFVFGKVDDLYVGQPVLELVGIAFISHFPGDPAEIVIE